MTFFLGFICGCALGAFITHLAHEYLDAMLPKNEQPIDPPLWLHRKDDEK